MIAPEVKKSAYEIESDKAQLSAWLTADTDRQDAEYEQMKRTIAMAIREELTQKQREYLTMYYVEKLTMEEIADSCGVNKSSVCRTINRAENRIAKVMRYAFKRLQGPAQSKHRRNRANKKENKK